MRTKVRPSGYRGRAISGFFHCGEGFLIAACLIAISSPVAAQENAQSHSAQHQVPKSAGQREKPSDSLSCVTKPESATKTSSADSTVRRAEERQEQTSQESLGAVSDETAKAADPSKDLGLKDRNQSSEKQKSRSKENIDAEGGDTPQCTQRDRSFKIEAVTPD